MNNYKVSFHELIKNSTDIYLAAYIQTSDVISKISRGKGDEKRGLLAF